MSDVDSGVIKEEATVLSVWSAEGVGCGNVVGSIVDVSECELKLVIGSFGGPVTLYRCLVVALAVLSVPVCSLWIVDPGVKDGFVDSAPSTVVVVDGDVDYSKSSIKSVCVSAWFDPSVVPCLVVMFEETACSADDAAELKFEVAVVVVVVVIVVVVGMDVVCLAAAVAIVRFIGTVYIPTVVDYSAVVGKVVGADA